MNFVLMIGCFSLLLIGCSPDSNPEPEIKYKKVSFSKAFDSTTVKSENYVQINVDYVEFTKAKNTFVKDSLNGKVKSFISTPVFEIQTKSLDELSSALFADYKKLKKDFPESPAVYELERKIEVINENSKFVCIRFSEYSNMGGAHPNSVMLFSNINLQNGKEIKLAELFVSDYRITLNQIAEKRFRAERGLKPTDNLEEAGFWFKDNKFAVNDNFAITKEGLIFYFNDYEVAPHAVGPTEFKISFSEIRSLIKPSGFISQN